jgi:pantothenate kinase
MYEYRETQYIEETSNFKECVEILNQIQVQKDKLLEKYALQGIEYGGTDKEFDEKAVDMIIEELNVEFERYRDFVKNNTIIFPNDLLIHSPQDVLLGLNKNSKDDYKKKTVFMKK